MKAICFYVRINVVDIKQKLVDCTFIFVVNVFENGIKFLDNSAFPF